MAANSFNGCSAGRVYGVGTACLNVKLIPVAGGQSDEPGHGIVGCAELSAGRRGPGAEAGNGFQIDVCVRSN